VRLAKLRFSDRHIDPNTVQNNITLCRADSGDERLMVLETRSEEKNPTERLGLSRRVVLANAVG